MSRTCPGCKQLRAETLFGRDEDPCAFCMAGHVEEDAVPDDGSPDPDPNPGSTKTRTAPLPQGAVNATRELANRTLSRKHLLPFVLRFNPKYDAGWVHKDICQRLEKFSRDVADKKSPRLMLFMPPRHGKACKNNELVATPTGWKRHGELAVGDIVYAASGAATAVIAVSPEVVIDQRVTFSDGSHLDVHANHEWLVHDRSTGTDKVVETNYFTRLTKFNKPVALTTGSKQRCTYELPLRPLLQFPQKTLPIHPYFIGAWLGDGQSSEPMICAASDDDAVLHAAKACVGVDTTVKVHADTHVVYWYYKTLRATMRAMGVINNKHIPDAYKFSSVEQRLALLAGLIDTDGHVEPTTGRVRIATVSKQLADDICDVVRSMGWRAGMYAQQPVLSTSGIQGKQVVYYVSFNPDRSIPTVLPRKAITRFAEQRRVGVVSVETIPAEPGKCIQVAAADGLYVVGRDMIVTHNSTLSSIAFPAWHLGNYPDHEVISCSYSGSLAMKFSRKVRNMLRDPAYGSVFPACELDPDSQGAEEWLTTTGGGYVAAGVGGGITGKGAHVLVIDDPVKNREDAESPNVKESVQDWYTSTAYTRLAPGGGILLIMTRWADDDLAGWLLSQAKDGGEQWEVVKYPAIAEEDELYRDKGEPLHPERYDLAALKRIERAVGPRDWPSLFQQNPVPDTGAYFNTGMIHYYDPKERDDKALRFYSAWDLAIGEKDRNDYTVGMTIGVDRLDNIYVVDVTRGKWDSAGIVEKILDSYVLWKPAMVGIEKGHIEMTMGPFLRKRVAERKLHEAYFHELKTGRRDKEARSRAIQGRMQQGKVFFPRGATFTGPLVGELLRFPSGEHDDQVDALAWIGLMMAEFSGVQGYVKPKEVSWRDRLDSIGVTKRSRSAMSA